MIRVYAEAGKSIRNAVGKIKYRGGNSMAKSQKLYLYL